MRRCAFSWEHWRAVITVLRDPGPAYRAEHADRIERLLEQHAPDEPMVTLYLTDDLYLRSYNWARVQLGVPLPPIAREGEGGLSLQHKHEPSLARPGTCG